MGEARISGAMTEEKRDLTEFRGLSRSGDNEGRATDILKESRERDDKRLADLIERYATDEDEKE